MAVPTAVGPVRPQHQLGTAHFIRGVLTLSASQVVGWIGAAVLTVMLPRYLGDVGLGKLSFALVLTTLLGLGSTLGTGTYVSRAIARDPGAAPNMITAALAVRLPLSLIVVAATAVGITLLPIDSVTRQAIYILSLGMVLGAFDLTSPALQGFHSMKALAVIAVSTKLALAGVVAIILLLGGGPREAATAWLASQLVGLIVGYTALLRRTRVAMHVDWRIARAALIGGLPFFVWQAAFIVYGQIDTVILQFLANYAVIGWYGAAYRIVSLPTFVPVIVLTVAFPALSATVHDRPHFSAISRRSIQVVCLASVPIALGTMLLPDKLTQFLGLPASFANSWWPMILLAPHIPLVAFDMVAGTILVACDRQRQWAIAAVIAAVLNPVANLGAIAYTQHQYGNGAIGAAVITTLTELSLLVVGLRLMPTWVLGRSTLSDVARILVAGLVMSVFVWIGRGLPLLAVVALGGAAYATVCLAVRAVTVADLREVLDHISGRVLTRIAEPVSP